MSKRSRVVADPITLPDLMQIQDLQDLILQNLNPQQRLPLLQTNRALFKNIQLLQPGETLRPEITRENIYKYIQASNQRNIKPALVQCRDLEDVLWALTTYFEIGVIELPAYINIQSIPSELWQKVELLDISSSNKIICNLQAILENVSFLKINDEVRCNKKKLVDLIPSMKTLRNSWKNDKPIVISEFTAFASDDGTNVTEIFQKLLPFIAQAEQVQIEEENNDLFAFLERTTFQIKKMSIYNYNQNSPNSRNFLETQHDRVKELTLIGFRGTLSVPLQLQHLELINCHVTFDNPHIRIKHLEEYTNCVITFQKKIYVNEWSISETNQSYIPSFTIDLNQNDLFVVNIHNVHQLKLINYNPQIQINWNTWYMHSILKLEVMGDIADCKITLDKEPLNWRLAESGAQEKVESYITLNKISLTYNGLK